MFLLIRRISAYSGADLLLGVFDSAEAAGAARAEYAARYAGASERDPWHHQAYRESSLVPGDLVIAELDGPPGATEVFVVSEYFDSFGQLGRRFDSIHDTEAAADRRIDEIEAREDAQYALAQRARVRVLLSDAREDQPRIAWSRGRR